MAKTRIPKENEYKYRSIRRGLSDSLILDRVFEQQLRTHLGDEYRDEKETLATLKLTGALDVFKKSIRFSATKEDMKRFWIMAEKERWDRKHPLTKAEATAKFFAGTLPGQKIKLGSRPSDLQAKRDYPYYKPRPGSSRGKIATKQKGAQKVLKDLEAMLRSIFSIGEGAKKKAKLPATEITRSVSKTIYKD